VEGPTQQLALDDGHQQQQVHFQSGKQQGSKPFE
jgi:hypothetical protein